MKGNKLLSTLCGATVLHKPSRGETGTYLIREACFRCLFVFLTQFPFCNIELTTVHSYVYSCVQVCTGCVHVPHGNQRALPGILWMALHPIAWDFRAWRSLIQLSCLAKDILLSLSPFHPSPGAGLTGRYQHSLFCFLSKECWGSDPESLNFCGKFSSG